MLLIQKSKKVLQNNWFVVLLLLPLAFININNKHDWGDDFAQYILQAKHIVGTLPEMPVVCLSDYGPAVKGPLFSLLLTPTLLFEKREIILSKVIVSVGLILSCFWLFRFLKPMAGFFPALLAALVMGYNFIIVSTKNQVLPDTLFMALMMYGLYYVSLKNSRAKTSYVGLISLGLILLKPVGVIFPIMLLIISTIDQQNRTYLWQFTLTLIITVLVSFFIPYLWFDIGLSSNDLSWYSIKTFDGLEPTIMLKHLTMYWESILLFFDNAIPFYINNIGKLITGAFFIGGFFLAIFHKQKFAIILLLYLSILILYPYDGDPFRMLAISFPLVVVTIIYCCIKITTFLSLKKNILLLPILIYYILGNIPNLIDSAKGVRNSFGPYAIESIEMLNIMQTHTIQSDIIKCEKPWAIAYYSGRVTTPYLPKSSISEFTNICISNWTIVNIGSKINPNDDEVPGKMVFHNQRFELYSNEIE